MQAIIIIRCEQCERRLGQIRIDTADMADQVQNKINKIILAHRRDCQYYGAKVVRPSLG